MGQRAKEGVGIMITEETEIRVTKLNLCKQEFIGIKLEIFYSNFE